MELKQRLAEEGKPGREEDNLYGASLQIHWSNWQVSTKKDGVLWGQIWHHDHSDEAEEKQLQYDLEK